MGEVDIATELPAGTQVIGAIQFVDEAGVPYGVKHVENKPRVSCIPYLYDIAEGNVPGHEGQRILGFNTGIPNGVLEDITELSTDVPRPTTAVPMEVIGGAADTGVVIYTSTATGGSTSTLVDTAQDFTAGNIVAPGDLILLDSKESWGMVSVVTAQTLTVNPVFAHSVTAELADTYRIVDHSAGGTGVHVTSVHGLDANYDHQLEFVVMNGAAAVAIANNHIRINSLHSLDVGTGGAAAGNIDIQGAGAGPKYSRIGLGGNTSLQAHYTVPNGLTAYITNWGASASSVKSVRMMLRVTREFDEAVWMPTWQAQDIIVVDSGGRDFIFPVPIKVPERCDIKISGAGIGGVGEGSAGFGFWLE